MAVDICVGVTAGDIITKLQKKSRLNQDVIRKRFSSSTSGSTPVSPVESWPTSATSSMESLDKLKVPEEMVDAGEQFLFEAGGNIGEDLACVFLCNGQMHHCTQNSTPTAPTTLRIVDIVAIFSIR